MFETKLLKISTLTLASQLASQQIHVQLAADLNCELHVTLMFRVQVSRSVRRVSSPESSCESEVHKKYKSSRCCSLF